MWFVINGRSDKLFRSLRGGGGCIFPFHLLPSLDKVFLYLKYFGMLMKLRSSEQNLVTNFFKSKWPPDVILEVKEHKVLIFSDSHNLKTAISWDLEVISTRNFYKLTDDVIFIPHVSFNLISCVQVEIPCVHPTSPQNCFRFINCLQDIRHCER